MSAIAAGTGRSPIVRISQPRAGRPAPRRAEPAAAFIGADRYIPSSVVDLWRGAKPRPRR